MAHARVNAETARLYKTILDAGLNGMQAFMVELAIMRGVHDAMLDTDAGPASDGEAVFSDWWRVKLGFDEPAGGGR